ncbi:phage head closure protein [Clostridium sp.]|uniref:phage head closure protein n=1 Tax=Clostridium sp. TaxID=1506 RepID=UPI0039934F3D
MAVTKRYNQRISFLKAIKTTDKDGYISNATENFYSCWCEVYNLSAKEKYSTESIDLNMFNFRVRYCKKLDEAFYDGECTGYQISFRNKIYNIIDVDFLAYNKDEILFKAERVN